MKHAKLILLRHGQCEGGNILRGKTDVALTPLGLANMQARFKQLGLLESTASLAVFSSPLQRCRQFAEGMVAEANHSVQFANTVNDNNAHYHKVNADDVQIGVSSNSINLTSTQSPIQLQLMPQFQEIDFGDWDGQTFDALYQADREGLDRYWDNPWGNTPPDGEPMADFEARVSDGLATVTQHLASQIKLLESNDLNHQASPQANYVQIKTANALVVTHGGVIRHIISQVLGLERCKGLYSQLAIDYAASVVIDVYWPDVPTIDDKELGQAAVKPIYRLNWPS